MATANKRLGLIILDQSPSTPGKAWARLKKRLADYPIQAGGLWYTITRSLSLSSRYSLSHWDSMLLAACIEAGVDTLNSEDLSGGVTYDSVEVVNPFV